MGRKHPDPASSWRFMRWVGSVISEFSLRDAWAFKSQPLLVELKRKLSLKSSGRIITLTAMLKIRLPRFKPWGAPV